MGVLRHLAAARRGRAIVVGLAAFSCVRADALQTARDGGWQSAVEARQEFEAEPTGTHTRAAYMRVMENFRAIYHADPADAHAARAVAQVAELLAEEGREFGDGKALNDAAGQYAFLLREYPQSSAARAARGKDVALRAEAEQPRTSARPDAATARAEDTTAAARPRRDTAGTPEDAAALLAASSRAADATAASSRMPSRETQAATASGGDHYQPPHHARTASGTVSAPVAPADTTGETSSVSSHAPASVMGADAASPGIAAPKKLAQVTAIRHWSTPTYTRVAIDLGDEVTYQAARVENPDRIYFDLHHTRLAHELSGKSFAVTDDGFLTRVRAAQFSNDVTRVVLDVHEVSEYTAFLLPNPYRLIIDIHGKQAEESAGAEHGASTAVVAPRGEKESGAGKAEEAAADNAPAKVHSAHEHATGVAESSNAARPEVSTLPPMAVTDGSASFGLSSRKPDAAASAVAVAQPRVVIPSRPTPQKPVPNTVVSRSSDTGSEVAAVSQQPGRVVATSRPTSAPIVDKAGARTGSRRTREVAHVQGQPAEAPPPTAEGRTSLMRALGLKIGRIVIDAGHGGHDSGTLGADGIEEKDVVLDVALRLGKLLHDRLGAEIVYTRADDTFIPLETRTAIANKAQADLFISVHANSSADASARGVEVYYLNFTSDPDAMRVAGRENAVSTQSVHELSDLVKKIALKDKIDESRELASDVDESLYAGLTRGNAGLRNRGVKKAPFVVLIGANMPSILAEISFVTNPTDAGELQRPEYRERVAESLYKGVERYAGAINGAHPRSSTTERAAR